MTVAASPTRKPKHADTSDKLRRFIQAWWLRPENAFWMVLRSDVLDHAPFQNPSVDISCGDGVFSFLHCGGEFDASFDVFQSVGRLDRVRTEHADMFDHVDETYRPAITVKPEAGIDVGTDLKESMLRKAETLHLYRRLIQHDNNTPLPFPDESFACVHCNSAYWVKRIEPFLRELARVVRGDGRIVLHIKLDSMKDYTLAPWRDALGKRVLDILGRGRHETWQSLADRTTWEGRFRAAGLTIESATPFVTATHARVWDIGLRPIAPLLVRMASALTPETRRAIKRDWVDLFCELCAPLCRPEFASGTACEEPAEIQYVLRPC